MTSGGGSYSSVPDTLTECNLLIFKGILQSPVPPVVAQLIVGDKLIVETQSNQGPVVGRHAVHGVAGAIITRLPDMLRCLDQKYEYEATVISINAWQVMVEVRPK